MENVLCSDEFGAHKTTSRVRRNARNQHQRLHSFNEKNKVNPFRSSSSLALSFSASAEMRRCVAECVDVQFQTS